MARWLFQGDVTMEAIVFSLKHHWRFLNAKALELPALSWDLRLAATSMLAATMKRKRQGIIPLWTDRVMCYLKRLHHGIGELLASVVDSLERGGRDLQAWGGRRSTQIAEHGLQGSQRLTGPIETDLAAQARLNRVPLRAAGRIITHRHAPAQAIAEPALEWRFPQPGSDT